MQDRAKVTGFSRLYEVRTMMAVHDRSNRLRLIHRHLTGSQGCRDRDCRLPPRISGNDHSIGVSIVRARLPPSRNMRMIITPLARSDHFPPVEVSPETISLHKQLVELFQDYEMLTKRIRDQPCEEGSAQWRLQQAITRASGLFISKEAGIIQVSLAG